MDEILLKVTQQAMNYAIRSGITITSGYAISQCSRLMKTKNSQDREELGKLQRRLESKIRIISPAIDMIELITARGNTSLESALALTKSLRWDIQALGVRLSRAAADEELSRKGSTRAKTKQQKDTELKFIVSDMKSLLEKIEDAVPLINLAITTSGVSLSTNLPASISPSRLLQASTFLSTGDAQYSTCPARSVQIGPAFTLSLYMLFSGHALRPHDEEGFRNTTWQEVIHKARVKLVRTSLKTVDGLPAFKPSQEQDAGSTPGENEQNTTSIPAAAEVDKFAYQLLLVEDLDDGRVHTLEEDEPQPSLFDDVESAGIREVIPIHQISKIFYADTGKILNIGADGEVNNPVLLLKRDVNAAHPRRMMDEDENRNAWDDAEVDSEEERSHDDGASKVELDELSAQFAREMSGAPEEGEESLRTSKPWRLPAGLDPEWIALEVFTEEEEEDSDIESETGAEESHVVSTNSASSAAPPPPPKREGSLMPNLASALSKLRLSSAPSTAVSTEAVVPAPDVSPATPPTSNALVHVPQSNQMSAQSRLNFMITQSSVRTSLSLLEMLIRLTSLQQFQQASHLTITDELLNFFLEESSTTGAAPGDSEARKRIRISARARVGFDPYDESPIKRRGEHYQYHNDAQWDGDHEEGWNDEIENGHPQTPQSQGDRTPSMPRPSPSPQARNGTRSASSTPMRNVYSPRGVPLDHQGSFATPPARFKTSRPLMQTQGSRSSYSSPLVNSMRAMSVNSPKVKIEEELADSMEATSISSPKVKVEDYTDDEG